MPYRLLIVPPQPDALCQLQHDDGLVVVGVPAPHPSGVPGQAFDIPDGIPNGHGMWIRIAAPGQPSIAQHGRLFLNDGTLPYPWQPGETAVLAGVDLFQWPTVTPIPGPAFSPLQLTGRHGFANAAGQSVPLCGVTAFRLVELVATGRIADARAFIDGMRPANVFRVLVMAKNLFALDPTTGRSALKATLDLAQELGVYLSVVSLADSKAYTFDIDTHVREVGLVCAFSPACVFNELGNELYSLHPTQDDRLGELEYLLDLATEVPDGVALSLGSTHGPDDESDIFKDGDLLTIHGARDGGSDGWRWVRHTNEQRALADRLGKYVVNDEPRRDDLSPDKHLGLALLCRLFSLGDTFHFKGGLQCEVAQGEERTAFEARVRGWQAIPPAWQGEYKNAGHTNSPVKGFSGGSENTRVYSSIAGDRGYTLVLAHTPTLVIEWTWPTHDLILREGDCALYAVHQ